MVYTKNLLLLTMLAIPMVSSAQCEKWITHLMEKYHPSRESNMATCKVWPADKSKTIVGLTFSHEDDGDQNFYDLDVLVIDSQSGELIARDWQVNGLEGLGLSYILDFKVDTARYQLTPQLRAFGIRIHFTGVSHWSPSVEEYLNLYTLQEGKLQRVVNYLPVRGFYGVFHTYCYGEFYDYNRTISLGSDITNNYVNLIISEKNQKQILSEHGKDNCIEKKIDLPKKKYILHYNGVEYPLPKSLDNVYFEL